MLIFQTFMMGFFVAMAFMQLFPMADLRTKLEAANKRIKNLENTLSEAGIYTGPEPEPVDIPKAERMP